MAKTAFINLSNRAVSIQETGRDTLRRFLGGRGLGAKLLFDLVGPEVEPLAPDNALIFTTGPLGGSSWPASSRLHVTFKSPLTGAYGYANSGGYLGTELRHAGYDALVITGRAEHPVMLQIFDGDISFRDASALWGTTTSQTHELVLGPDGHLGHNGRLACIGPAGENLVRVSAIINDVSRAAARGGPGAVMGSKNLKAVLVQAANRAASPDRFNQFARQATQRLQTDPALNGLKRYGTLSWMDEKNLTGDQPAKNHQLVQIPFIHQVNARAFDAYLMRHKGCHACPIQCGRQSAVAEGLYTVNLEGPETETTSALGPMCWVSDAEAIIYANHLCNEYGLDTISTGSLVAFAMELHQRDLLNDDELSLEWGDQDTLLGLIEQIVDRRGLGSILAEGTRRAAQQIGNGADYYAMHVKGLEMPGQDPRFAKAFGLGHCTSNRGADHLYALPVIERNGNGKFAATIFPPEILPELMNPANEKYKADVVVYGEHFCAVTDALGICKFSTVEENSLLPADLASGVSALLEREVTEQDLLLAGERIVNLERMYNVRHGLSRADDYLPARFTRESVPLYRYQLNATSGEWSASGEPVGYGLVYDLDAMLDRYYSLRGWNRQGIPTPETLRRLDLIDTSPE